MHSDKLIEHLLQVETVFHEFGHALQHMLTRQDEGLVAGIRGVEWDAVELPSQFMENWCYHKSVPNSTLPSFFAVDKLSSLH
jgi:Zn-dependent oligopeptidase